MQFLGCLPGQDLPSGECDKNIFCISAVKQTGFVLLSAGRFDLSLPNFFPVSFALFSFLMLLMQHSSGLLQFRRATEVRQNLSVEKVSVSFWGLKLWRLWVVVAVGGVQGEPLWHGQQICGQVAVPLDTCYSFPACRNSFLPAQLAGTSHPSSRCC